MKFIALAVISESLEAVHKEDNFFKTYKKLRP